MTALCWVIVVFDGYDLIVYGTVLPHLLREPGWGLTEASAGLLGSLAFAGMLIGAVLAGTFADLFGRRRTVLACTAWFSAFTALCALASGPEVFGAPRLLAGIGLGGLVPSANASSPFSAGAGVAACLLAALRRGARHRSGGPLPAPSGEGTTHAVPRDDIVPDTEGRDGIVPREGRHDIVPDREGTGSP